MSVLKIKDANNQWQSIPAIKGVDGIDGTNGVDGYSPTATVSKNGDTATISITDKNGTTTATVKDGADGTNGRDGYVQYTAGDNITIENNVISASGGGIPILDLYTGANNNSIGFLYQTTGSIVDAVNNFLKEGHNYFYINLIYNGTSSYGASNFILKPYWKPSDDIQSQNWTLRLYSDVQMFPNITKRPFIILIDMQTAHNNDNELYITYFRINTTFMDNYLTKDNTSSYTPTSDYHPATKKYVDDAISTAITSVLGGSY